MDEVIKKYFDRYRRRGELPPELRGKIPGNLAVDQQLLDKWRDWRAGIRWRDKNSGAELMGALDDCLLIDSAYAPLDYKTRGYPVKEDSASYYQNQLDTYTLLLRENGYPHAPCGYFVFFHPFECTEVGSVRFQITPQRVATDPDRASRIFLDAVRTLQSPMLPSVNNTCGFCQWLEEARESSLR